MYARIVSGMDYKTTKLKKCYFKMTNLNKNPKTFLIHRKKEIYIALPVTHICSSIALNQQTKEHS